MDLSGTIPVFLVTLREGVEAALVVGIVLACLGKAKATDLQRSVYGAIAAGLGVSVLFGGILLQGLGRLENSTWVYAPALEQGVKGGIP